MTWPGRYSGFVSHTPGYWRCAMKRTCLVLAVLMTLFAAAPAQAAIPHSEITLFSDFGHDLVDGSEWRWTSDDEDLDAYVEDNTTLTVEVGPKFDAEIKHWFTFRSAARARRSGPASTACPSRSRCTAPGWPVDGASPPRYGSLALDCPYHSSGAFEIRELVVGPDGKVQRAWVLFEQRCNARAPGAFGEIRIGMPRRSRSARCPRSCAGPPTTRGTAPASRRCA